MAPCKYPSLYVAGTASSVKVSLLTTLTAGKNHISCLIQSEKFKTLTPQHIRYRRVSLSNSATITWVATPTPMTSSTSTTSTSMNTTAITPPSTASTSASSSCPCTHYQTCTHTTWIYYYNLSHYSSITTASYLNQSSLNCLRMGTHCLPPHPSQTLANYLMIRWMFPSCVLYYYNGISMHLLIKSVKGVYTIGSN